ncbi:Phosphatidylinositol 3,4,5-trisphosphate 3-phosphatase and dual-specificity protein phosphatase PTEN [Eumeta japonica]|uniref:Phosphatidylinositol 3,4,5-trisphosphate 3-phosphatase and dual-specificity protein phosphatase PTEN n=1 Tax=Eumeta variegata TaxID=151549 RepID=A0A4C1WGI5_EUMVA|nr:Phosphatidylinositol 3,4,5-trisphosphate 3-phosphatase and dual-specificity protein phosphatase PTEN [Eumeta japonica]
MHCFDDRSKPPVNISTMVCCYLLYSGQETTADGALNHYGKERTHDLKGVTIPSQRRYVEYYAALVRGRLEYRACAVHIAELALSPPPTLNGGQCTLELWVAPAAAATTLGSAKLPACSYEMRRNESEIRMSLNHCTPLAGDVRVELYSKPKMMRKEKLFHFWFNTYFVTQQVGAVKVKPPDNCPDVEVFKLCLNKWQLDDAHKDKQHKLYSPNFKVELMVQKPPERSAWSGGRASAPARPPGAMKAASSPPDSFSDSTDDDREDDRDDDRDDENWSSGTSTEESVKLLDCVSPQLYADSRAFDAYCARPYADSPRDEVEGKIPKVSSDHTISSTDVCDRHYEPNRTCKSPTDNCKKKYLFFKKDSPEGRGGEEARECDRRTPTDFVSTFSKPRLSLGDMRASWREFSDKHFGTEHSKQKKKAADSSTESKDDS